MSKKQVDLGTANQGDGTPIRTAFGFLNDNHTELYSLLGDGTTLSVTGDVAISSGAATIQAGSVENSMLADDAVGADELASNAVVTASIVDDNVTPAKINILDDSLAATDAHIMVGDGTDFSNVAVSGDIAITNTGATTIQAGAVENSMIADNAVDHDELANRFANRIELNGTGNLSIECDDASVFLLTGNVATATYTFNDMKQNQVIDLILSGTLSSAAITFAGGTGLGTTTFNKVGTTSLSTSATNHISMICVKEDSGSSIVNYTVNTYTSDDNPDAS
jgi:hypothetical protein|tara:strand:+ start:1315 stop:2154 length:840 start_codon:yes stop_codon:yes gene_type:complete